MSLDKVKNILLILSGKGGVGKSSITTQLALSLSLAGKSVGILDVDLTGPSIPRFLGIESSRIKQAPGGWLPVEVYSAQTLEDAPAVTYPSARPASSDDKDSDPASAPRAEAKHNGSIEAGSNEEQENNDAAVAAHNPLAPGKRVGPLYAMSLAFLLASRSSAIVWRGPKKTAMVRQFLTDVLWPDLDFLLIDTPPGTSDEHISVVETLLKSVATASLVTGGVVASHGPNLAGAVVVTTPQAVAVADVKKELNFCAKTGVKVVGVVENMSGYVCPCCGVETKLFSKGGGKVMAQDFGVPFLGDLPVDSLWGLLVEEGRRPVYQKVERRGEGAEPSVDEDIGNTGIEGSTDSLEGANPREPGLLVDKYRSCSLSPAFAAIARKVVDIVDRDIAVTVNRTLAT